MSNIDPTYDLNAPYTPVALYFHEADLVEYVREDASCIYKRIDETLTLALEMDSQLPIGFRIKGFRNLFLKATSENQSLRSESAFIELIDLLDKAACVAGNEVFEHSKRIGYRCAADIARSDDVKLPVADLAA